MKEMSRRQSLALGIGIGTGAALLASEGEAQAEAPPAGPPNPMLTAPVTQGSPMLERDSEHAVMIDGLHKGKGRVSLRRFGFENAQAPAGFVTFIIPPSASEGVHTHGIGLPAGPFDEYYYVMAGAGEMSMDGQVMPVKEGDHVHAPMGVAHGIENTMPEGDLKVLVTYIRRA